MIFQFNDISVDTDKFLLKINNEVIAVEPKVFDLIVYLISHRDRLVSRSEIFDTIWLGREVSDATLSNHIKNARNALGDDGQLQQVIKTIHGRGYQFIADIKETNNSTASLPSIKLHRQIIIVICSIIMFTLFFYFLMSRENVNYQKKVTSHFKIAVLPFTNTKTDKDTNYFGDAISGQITGELIYLKNMTVRPYSSVRKYSSKINDPILVGKELDVDYILSGSYLKLVDEILLNIELIEVNTNKLLWRGKSIKVKSENAFELQDIVAQTVIDGLKVEFSTSEMARIKKDISNSPLAYEYYLRSTAFPHTTDGHKFAIKMLKKSIALDEHYAPAYVQLGGRIRRLEQFGLTDSGESQDTEKYYQKALSINPELMSALAYLSMYYTEANQINKAMKLAKKMSMINPIDANTHFTLGYIYRYAGMAELAIQEMEIAVSMDAKNPDFRSLMNSYSDVGEFKRALKLIENYGNSPFTQGWKGLLYFRMGDNDNAIKYFDQVIENDPNGLWGYISILHKGYLSGNHEMQLHAIKQLEATNIPDGEILFYTASYYGLIGDKIRCLETLNKAVDSGYFNNTFMASNNYFNSVRKEPEFIQITNKAKEKHLAFRKKFF